MESNITIPRIILASASPRRQTLFKYITATFEIIPAGIDETISEQIPVTEQPAWLAKEKAEFLSETFPDALIVGCDTSVLIGEEILGKPKDFADAVHMLQLLSGNTHTVITGCCIRYQGRSHVFSEKTDVVFYPLTDVEIVSYIQTGEPFDKAGGYGIQSGGCCFVREIHGCYHNVVGLPVARLKREIDTILKNSI